MRHAALFSLLLLCLTALALPALPQTVAGADKKTEKEAKRKEREHVEQVLTAYTKCTSFSDGLRISKVDRISKDKNEKLVREVAAGDVRPISRTDSYRVMVNQNVPDYFANIRPDRSDPTQYANDKETLIKWITYTNTLGRLMSSKFPKETYYNGFETYLIERGEIAGNQLGTALLFDDANSIVLTIYLLNQRSQYRKFQTLEEWRAMSDRFLKDYTGCVRNNLLSLSQ